ncbi:hypothetical protein HNQ59_000247 [Chitinivorax tropicus]|uniref:Nucleotidyltransferase family protein n=1 Tax=Chitinivorax tropicus TaxID=714531 RepID=A0A840MHI5_9PROT|nr:nucleotidyltransferase family protein [Chitinivorax tropicus]MBB5016985.1 hypothetical protein [Chitinivorax tropicus]
MLAWLAQAARLDLPDWYLAAGCIRNQLWDHWHGYTTPSGEQDIDLIYHDPQASPEQDQVLSKTLSTQTGNQWEVVNQAYVHRWYRDQHGQPIAAHNSCIEAMASWPETATCIGLRFDLHGWAVASPLGLDDLFGMIWRRNPGFSDLATYQHRQITKQVARRWPKVRII